MIDGKKLTSKFNPIIFETQSYNLSDLSWLYLILLVRCFFPRNELVISYSKECGVWKELKSTITKM